MSADESKSEGAVHTASGEAPREHEGGPRFSRRVLIMVSVGAVVLGVVTAEGIRSAGVKTTSAATQPVDDGAAAARNQAEVEDLAAGSRAPVMPSAATRGGGPDAECPDGGGARRRRPRAATRNGRRTST